MDTTAATIELHASADTASFTRTHVVADSIETPVSALRPASLLGGSFSHFPRNDP
jgi:hypothetical protein